MYTDSNTWKCFARSLISHDLNTFNNDLFLDKRFYHLAAAIIKRSLIELEKVEFANRSDEFLKELGLAIIETDIKRLLYFKNLEKEGNVPSYLYSNLKRYYHFGNAIIMRDLTQLNFLSSSNNIYFAGRAIIDRNEKLLDLIDDSDYYNFILNIKTGDLTDVKNVIWDYGEHLRCLSCGKIIEPDQMGYLQYYYCSRENKMTMNTKIYFQEVNRHTFYKFCSRKCAIKKICE